MPTVYQIVTDRIIKKLESGVVPWRKPWTSASAPHNGTTGHEYRGINYLMLASSDFSHGDYYTFKQAKAIGGTVRKGQHGTPVVYWLWPDREKATGNTSAKGSRSLRPIPLYSTVFNRDQIDGLPPVKGNIERVANPIQSCAAIVQAYKDCPALLTGNRACYQPSADTVTMPLPSAFLDDNGFYAVLFHELAHSTGHKSRLNRTGITDVAGFGSESYSKEELIAEVTSAMLCGVAGISPATIDNSAAYIDNWLGALQRDPALVIRAAQCAQKAADYIQGKQAPKVLDDSEPEIVVADTPQLALFAA